MNAFGLRLRELRESKSYTQPALAEIAGLSKAGIADLESGRRQPSWATVQALCKALNVDCTAFNESAASDVKPRGQGRPLSKPAKKTKKGR